MDSLSQSFTIPGPTLLPLRLFLGFTFVYAALQKLSDPGFFKPGSTSYIGTQIIGFMHGSPIRIILQHAAEHAVLAGALVIFGEFSIGVLVLLGLFTRIAALLGLLINLTFFLSASWNVYPYFLGSDIVFLIAWLTLALTGPGALALDALIPDLVDRSGLANKLPGPLASTLLRLLLGPGPVEESPLTAIVQMDRSSPPTASILTSSKPTHSQSVVSTLTRREAVLGSLAALGLVLLGLVPKVSLPSAGPVSGTTSSAGSKSGTSSGGGSSGSNLPPGVPAGSKKVGNISQVRQDHLNTTSPQTGDPAVVVKIGATDYVAYDAICTHAGCTVQYYPPARMLVCPCHGGVYDPRKNAEVVQGPPPTPLTKLPITVTNSGDIYLA